MEYPNADAGTKSVENADAPRQRAKQRGCSRCRILYSSGRSTTDKLMDPTP